MAAHSVELLLDDESAAAVRGQWQALLDAGLPSRARNPSPTNAPHLTLLAATHLPAELDPALAEACAGTPLPAHLGGLVLFGTGRPVLARLVVPTAELLALQARAYAVVAGSPVAGHLLGHAAPGDWTPHVTLARGIPRDRLGEALAALDATRTAQRVEVDAPGGPGASTSTQPAAFVRVRRWDPDAAVTTDLSTAPRRP